MKKILLGDEAFAQGALDAGLSGCYAYPGTPSTEIMEYIQGSALAKERGVHREWSSNEKTAMEEALGVSYAGKRAIVCMKHVGLNVAGDGFVNAAVTGTNGGLIVAVADDPSMHSSQNEQDSRAYAQFAMIPCLEPSSQQEAYDMAAFAFDLSEKHQTPVMMRLTTRLSHSRANIETKDVPAPQNERREPENPRRFILLPAIAKNNVKKLCEKQADFVKLSENSNFNKLVWGNDTSLGIVATGIAYNYVMEAFGGDCPHPVLKISQYPVPKAQLAKLMGACDKIMVVEEGAPFVESQLRTPLEDARILGRLTGALPRTGELNPYIVAKAFKLDVPEPRPIPELVKNRPPRLCDGCPHINTYQALTEALKGYDSAKVFGDIGCYTLGALPPFNAISSCVDMGASITMAKGASDAGIHPAVAVIGDSTFTHSGMTGILDAVWENSKITVMILDNGTTGMTGGQTSIGAGFLERICQGLGVDPDHIKSIVPLPKNHEENVKTIKAELDYPGLSVIVSKRECIQTLKKKK
ncbi:MAG: indolepyruvate ferredoxin oxidoreductase [Lentisphaerae bacterium]|jgi:indolepyruvate ferredoxin oxidoreductase alpha subunit|nr:indolepyruvate ferredoxin oxidoreductase [Lentisphaerota bacterium]